VVEPDRLEVTDRGKGHFKPYQLGLLDAPGPGDFVTKLGRISKPDLLREWKLTGSPSHREMSFRREAQSEPSQARGYP
jgi:hypothetical protein